MKKMKTMFVWFFLLLILGGCGQHKEPEGEEKAQLPDNFFNQEGTGMGHFPITVSILPMKIPKM